MRPEPPLRKMTSCTVSHSLEIRSFYHDFFHLSMYYSYLYEISIRPLLSSDRIDMPAVFVWGVFCSQNKPSKLHSEPNFQVYLSGEK